MSERTRWVVLVALVVTFITGASLVYQVGSHNRRQDRQAVLAYEIAVTAQVREMLVTAGSLEDAVSAFEAGRMQAAALARYASERQKTLAAVAVKIAAVKVPIVFGIGEKMFAPAAAEYARAAGLYASFASCAENSVGPSASCIATANASQAAGHALALYQKATRLLQSTRERLGLRRSANFPSEPPR